MTYFLCLSFVTHLRAGVTALGQPIIRGGKMLMYIYSCHGQQWSNTLQKTQTAAHDQSISNFGAHVCSDIAVNGMMAGLGFHYHLKSPKP